MLGILLVSALVLLRGACLTDQDSQFTISLIGYANTPSGETYAELVSSNRTSSTVVRSIHGYLKQSPFSPISTTNHGVSCGDSPSFRDGPVDSKICEFELRGHGIERIWVRLPSEMLFYPGALWRIRLEWSFAYKTRIERYVERFVLFRQLGVSSCALVAWSERLDTRLLERHREQLKKQGRASNPSPPGD